MTAPPAKSECGHGIARLARFAADLDVVRQPLQRARAVQALGVDVVVVAVPVDPAADGPAGGIADHLNPAKDRPRAAVADGSTDRRPLPDPSELTRCA
jgi:hypothetical protein